MPKPLVKIGQRSELTEGAAKKFLYEQDHVRREGILLLVGGEVVAFENLCRHIPLTLDYNDGQFFTPDKKYLRCQTHGALYEPATGLCVDGPCRGASLKKLDIDVQGDDICLVNDKPRMNTNEHE